MSEQLQNLLWPVVIWVSGWILNLADEKIRAWVERKEDKKLLAIYEIVAKAVQSVYEDIVRSKKANGSFTEEDKTTAMQTALSTIRVMANDSGVTLPNEEGLKLMVEQTIADRRKGSVDPFWKRIFR